MILISPEGETVLIDESLHGRAPRRATRRREEPARIRAVERVWGRPDNGKLLGEAVGGIDTRPTRRLPAVRHNERLARRGRVHGSRRKRRLHADPAWNASASAGGAPTGWRHRSGRVARSTLARSGRHRDDLSKADVRGRQDRDPRRRAGRADARRSEGDDERAVLAGSRAEDTTRAARSGRSGALRRRQVLRVSSRAQRRQGPAWCARDRPSRTDGRESHLQRFRGGRLGESQLPRAQPRRGALALGRRVEPEDDPRERVTWHRHPEQRTLCRPAGVESPTVRQGSGHRKAGLAAQPVI